MNPIDSKGRFLGRVSVVDTVVVLFLLLFISPLLLFAYRVGKPLEPKIIAVLPEETAPSAPFQVHGVNFLKESPDRIPLIRIGDQLAYRQYYGADLLVGYVPAGMKPGNYPVSVTNPDGRVATWEGKVTIVEPSVRSRARFVVTIAFPDLQPEEADYLERCFQMQSKTFRGGSQPRLLRILKRGPMSSFQRKLSEEGRKAEGKEHILADVLILSDWEEWNGKKRYFYQGQPLLMERVKLEFGGHSYSGIIHRWPRPYKPRQKDETTP